MNRLEMLHDQAMKFWEKSFAFANNGSPEYLGAAMEQLNAVDAAILFEQQRYCSEKIEEIEVNEDDSFNKTVDLLRLTTLRHLKDVLGGKYIEKFENHENRKL